MAAGEPLQAIDTDIWLAEGPVVDFYSFPYPTRCVIVRLPGERLWVWSPIALDDDLQAAVDARGEVAFLVSPNKLHHLSLGQWQRAYPGAEHWGPASTARKRPDLAFDGELGDHPPAAWAGAIDQAWFRGSPLLDEVVFCHLPSRTAILADLSENFTEAFLRDHWAAWQRPIARLWRITEPWGYAPLELRLSFLDRRTARAALAKVLGWQPRRVVMAHGRWQDEEGRAFLERAFRWLRR
ncbi:MAG TPA: DUF4336 domain-containing protein [Gammaproteobacteria bacterium]|nr:DUF4336 domain-containing protein [Gammaproteobacteria bacterium]